MSYHNDIALSLAEQAICIRYFLTPTLTCGLSLPTQTSSIEAQLRFTSLRPALIRFVIRCQLTIIVIVNIGHF